MVCLELLSCRAYNKTDVKSPAPDVALIKFSLDITDDENVVFRHELIKKLTRTSIRGGPVGLNIAIMSSYGYEISLVGSCDGAIQEVGPIIKEISGFVPNALAAQESFMRTASCSRYTGTNA